MNKLNKKELAFALLVVVVTILIVVPTAYIIAALIGGVLVVAFGHRLISKKDDNANP